ncbi:class I SAM-dependent methyltransferase [Tropicimonas sp.]|uniref:class I SAM-dependent methyltransferase n=1 Tax=Tropicimonas sp. TaxID=2067044 RepID=UPI003A84CFCE
MNGEARRRLATRMKKAVSLVFRFRDQTGIRGFYRFAHGWRFADRAALINHLFVVHGFESYLEIGVRNRSDLYDRINATTKVGVDPDPTAEADHILTSDSYFERSDATFDIIFIDGLHTGEQVARDIANALKALNPGGMILLHDLNPPTALHAREEFEIDGAFPAACPQWNGSSWRGYAMHRKSDPGLEMYVVDVDWGVGFIRPGRQILYAGPAETYSDLESHRKEILRLITVREFLGRHPARPHAP